MEQNVETKFLCPKCKKKFESILELHKHITTSHSKNKKCELCNKKFRSDKSLTQHINTVHQNKFKCASCNKEFKSQKALNQHKRNSRCKKNYVSKGIACTFCNKFYKDTNSLNQHIISKHKKPFVCPQCQKGFKSKLAMDQHFRMKHESVKEPKQEFERSKLGVYERTPFTEKLMIGFKILFNNKQILVLDECVGNDTSVINALKTRYKIIPLPNELKSHKDKDLRLALKEKGWGLVSKDFEMTTIARKLGIKPVYFLKEVRGHRALFRISKRNLEVE